MELFNGYRKNVVDYQTGRCCKNVVGQIYTRFENAGLKIIAAKMMLLSRTEAETFYAVHRQRPF